MYTRFMWIRWSLITEFYEKYGEISGSLKEEELSVLTTLANISFSVKSVLQEILWLTG
jgi:hypothetical protein